MEDLEIQQRFHLLQKEVEAAVSLTEQAKLDLVSAIDDLKIEVEILRRFMERYHPNFSSLYPKLKEEVLQEFDPEWMEIGAKKKKAERENRRRG